VEEGEKQSNKPSRTWLAFLQATTKKWEGEEKIKNKNKKKTDQIL